MMASHPTIATGQIWQSFDAQAIIDGLANGRVSFRKRTGRSGAFCLRRFSLQIEEFLRVYTLSWPKGRR